MENLVKKNMKGIALLLIFWSFIYDIRYQIIPPLMHGEALGMKSVVTSFLYGHYHMWYLYMIIGMYFITPYLRCIVRYENRNMVLCFIGLGLLVQFTKPMINGLTSIWPSFAIFSKFIDKFNLIYMREISSYAMLVTGAKFIVKSAVAMVTFSSFLEIFAPIVDVTNEHLLAVCFGGVFLGAGVGFVIRAGGCLDGTETVLFINVVIYSIAGFLFGLDRAMYSLLTYFITSKVIDFVESGVEQAKAAMIITDEGQMIEEGGCRMRHPFLYFISA